MLQLNWHQPEERQAELLQLVGHNTQDNQEGRHKNSNVVENQPPPWPETKSWLRP